MKKYVLICTLLLSASLFTQDNTGFIVPLLTSEPTLEDFNGMQPSTNLAQSMAMVTNFIQREPNDGSSSSQKTEVYVGYDEDNFYAVFLAFDDPSQVRANLAARENIWNDDKVGLLIDTFNDQVSGYAFRSSPLGVQWDARWLEVSKSPGFDDSYDAVWYNDGRLTEQGYQVIFTIPMRTLRFTDVPVQNWRIQFEREVMRNPTGLVTPAIFRDA